jgi:hypothetical protein
MQNSSVNGSQGGSAVNVIVGVTDGATTAVRDGDLAEWMAGGGDNVAVPTTFVLTTITGVSVTPVVAQDTRINKTKIYSIWFIEPIMNISLGKAVSHYWNRFLRHALLSAENYILNPSAFAYRFADFLLQVIGFRFQFF